LPSGEIIATKKEGVLVVIDPVTTAHREIGEGLPRMDSRGQGGLLDVTVSPNFELDSLIYLTYSAGNSTGGTSTHLGKAVLSDDSTRLENFEVLFVAEPFKNSTTHYGSRVVVLDTHLYMSIGDRGDKNFADHVSQDTSNVLGTTIRLNLDGSIPEDNPFINDPNFHPAIYSYGHRNVQGMAIHPTTNEIWQSEHGEQDGDRINKIQAGGNYGWPIAHTGCTYVTGRPIGVPFSERQDVIPPAFSWECGSGGFPPAGMTFYDGNSFPEWQGDLFVGGLASKYLGHFREAQPGILQELSGLLKDEGWRIRDVVVSPFDGGIYLAVEGGEESIVRIIGK
jgi:glucose/arabinose dehydrogenase